MSRKWAPTDTPEARAEIFDVVHEWLHAEPRRDKVLRKHYSAGVDVRDLVRLCAAAGWTVSVGHMFRLVKGARLDLSDYVDD
jgi:hypothetical protein